ncbi:PQQ-binding-like beta-propeller repeat protein [Streptomyces luteogriseus]|uniref:PQQ-binding-like beta-propeller repeat protein n=1 Tax=Streptomyces luteogriseus TaxID=68233 RepID=UPI0027D7C853|nr:PQQ-binding-like beta-propeller repeat protein [Streptomyces luteogriseus]
MKAISTTTYGTAWSYRSPRGAATVRLAAGGYVYVGDGNGKLVLSERTGAVVWSHQLWAEPHPMENVLAEEDWRGWVNPGIATHGGRVFAPGQDGVLTAFAD